MTIEQLYQEAKKRNATDMQIYFRDYRVPEGIRPECYISEASSIELHFKEDWLEISPLGYCD